MSRGKVGAVLPSLGSGGNNETSRPARYKSLPAILKEFKPAIYFSFQAGFFGAGRPVRRRKECVLGCNFCTLMTNNIYFNLSNCPFVQLNCCANVMFFVFRIFKFTKVMNIKVQIKPS